MRDRGAEMRADVRGAQRGPAAMPTIYLHSSWRTGSTYVWSKFRGCADTYCYFEPLNEHLADATSAFIDAFAPWPYANHPALEAPYLEEFRPLLEPGGGLAGFPAHLTYGAYRADHRAAWPELATYFDRLEAFAVARGRRAVFGCVRTDLRLDWFRAHRDGVHIFIRRDPRRQFVSFLKQAAKGNRYFLERGWVILGANQDDPAFAPLRRLVDVPRFDGPTALRDAFYARQAWTTEWSALYTIFYAIHRLQAATIDLKSIDLVLDMDRLSEDLAAIADAERRIEKLTGTAISLADCRIERYDRQLARSDPFFAALEAKLDARIADVRTQPPDT